MLDSSLYQKGMLYYHFTYCIWYLSLDRFLSYIGCCNNYRSLNSRQIWKKVPLDFLWYHNGSFNKLIGSILLCIQCTGTRWSQENFISSSPQSVYLRSSFFTWLRGYPMAYDVRADGSRSEINFKFHCRLAINLTIYMIIHLKFIPLSLCAVSYICLFYSF